jgi:hypothetical protein
MEVWITALIVQVTLASSTRLWNVVTWYTYIYVYSFHTHHQHTKHINIFFSLLIELNQVLVKPIMVPKTKQKSTYKLEFQFS